MFKCSNLELLGEVIVQMFFDFFGGFFGQFLAELVVSGANEFYANGTGIILIVFVPCAALVEHVIEDVANKVLVEVGLLLLARIIDFLLDLLHIENVCPDALEVCLPSISEQGAYLADPLEDFLTHHFYID